MKIILQDDGHASLLLVDGYDVDVHGFHSGFVSGESIIVDSLNPTYGAPC